MLFRSFPVQTRMFARLNFFKVTLRSMWEDYSDFISNFRDDLEEPFILADKVRFEKMFKTNTLGDYLGIPTRKTTFSEYHSTSVARCTPSGGSNDQGLYFIKSSRSWDSIFSQWTGSIGSLTDISCSNTSSDSESTVFLSGADAVSIGNFGPASLQLKMTTTLKFKQMPCRVLVYNNKLKTKFYLDSAFTISADGKTALLNIPLGNISEKLNSSGDDTATACSVAILIPFSSFASTTTAITCQPIDIYSHSELSEVTYDSYPFQTITSSTIRPRLLAYRFRTYESVYNAYIS